MTTPAQGRVGDLAAAAEGSVAGVRCSAGLEDSLWLCPIEDRRGPAAMGEVVAMDEVAAAREGMLAGLSLSSYLQLVEYTGRLFRQEKVSISSDVEGIFARLGSTAETWQLRMNKLSGGRLLGRFFATSRSRLREIANKLGVHHLANFSGCPAPG